MMVLLRVTLLLAFVVVVALFAAQNLGEVVVAFSDWRVSTPLAALILVVYLAGMITGGSVVSFLKSSVHQATTPTRRAPSSR